MSTSAIDLPKQYDHTPAQERWTAHWLAKKYFHAEPDPSRQPFTIVIPPPNVTGALHLGHALNNTLQDILIRTRRMQGFNALWMPGTDHAGIATQAVVEKRLFEEEKKTRHDLGREALVDRIWDWKNAYEARILEQLQQMGCSCDWDRTRFTLDAVCARAVRHTFFRMFQDGLIYRGKRLVNWDTFLQTAVSDDEVFHETVKGHFWHIRYPIIDPQPGEPDFVSVATTRPETMLGDTAVAVHPDPAAALDQAEKDLREKFAAAPQKERADIKSQLDDLADRRQTMLPQLEKLRDMAKAGRNVMLPLMQRPIPLVADEWAKPELGSGCVKITPAHDPNDYEVGKRQSLPMINILNPDGTLNENAGAYKGLTTKKARAQVVADLEAQGLMERVEDREIDLAHSDRSKTPIEPYLADQWFVKMSDLEGTSVGNALRGVPEAPNDVDTSTRPTERHRGRSLQSAGLAQMAMDAVIDGRVQVFPTRYAKSYLDWLSEKRDWPVSRQLWWGHRIPVWQVTIKSDLYQREQGSFRDSRRRVENEFRDALRDFVSVCGSSDEVALGPSEESESTFFICTRSERADMELESFYRRHHRARASQLFDIDPPLEPYLSKNDPRFEPDERLWNLIGVMSEQDPGVLDTWFSSALWPHSTLGWPGPKLASDDPDNESPDWEKLRHFYPTSVLVTSRDIITLWVARMVLTGLYNVGDVPFRHVYIHPKILDAYGETMSKSKGNGIDPLDVIAKFGADALRFGLAHMATETQDVRMPVEFECPHCQKTIEQTQKNRVLPRVKCSHCNKDFSTQWATKSDDTALPRAAVISERFEVARNFCNKLWNASRFVLLNLEGYAAARVDRSELAVEDRWLLSRLSTVTSQVTEALEGYHFADAARVLYDFAWDEFCSFYVEMVKTRLTPESQGRPVAQRVLAYALDTLLRLLHPITPFLTEEVWHLLAEYAPKRGLDDPAAPAESVIVAPWPQADATFQDAQIEARFARFQTLLGGLREVRARQNIAPKTPIHFSVRCDGDTAKLLEKMAAYFASMAGATATDWGPGVQSPPLAANFSAAGCEVFVDLAEHIDVAAEIIRNEKEIEKLRSTIAAKEKKLSNESFTSRAPADVVAREREQLQELRDRLTSTTAALADLNRRNKS
jgi:valyl-tRNA synthetase